ncbi:MAG: hypothetical protein D6785_12380 [Planctomycetota bacterium]|nr:MAG: hypothetical protein D6785_12380 [Planctomycetota bacterium]
MKLKLWFLGTALLTIGLMASVVSVSEGSKKKNHFVGVKKCAKCHKKSKYGAQYLKWKKMKHAQAYKVLGTAKAKEVAKKRGIKDPQKSMKCLKCHVTGIHETGGIPKNIKKEDGVGCESCHGAGSGYYKKSIMKKIGKARKKGHKAWAKKAEEYGLHLPTPKTCSKCHNSESPTYKGPDPKKDWKGFVKEFKKRFKEKIQHYKKGHKMSENWK